MTGGGWGGALSEQVYGTVSPFVVPSDLNTQTSFLQDL